MIVAKGGDFDTQPVFFQVHTIPIIIIIIIGG
jgi:hypothetical protein